MRKIGTHQIEPLHGAQATRAIEASAQSHLPPHTLMARAGLAVAKLTQALAPHAQIIWVACGPGNNGGDGLIAAIHLFNEGKRRRLNRSIHITLVGEPDNLPADAAHALHQALSAGLQIDAAPPSCFDFAIDALLGIGAARAPRGNLAAHLDLLRRTEKPVLCVDLPSGLIADSGQLLPTETTEPLAPGPRHTLSLLTLKPGLFTAQGRDASGDIWFDSLSKPCADSTPPNAYLAAFPEHTLSPRRLHTTHKGTHGEVLVMGGQGITSGGIGMTGAAVLAARAALRSGAGRVYLSLLETGTSTVGWDPQQPELMLRNPVAVLSDSLLERSAVVCGCGGGDAIVPLLAATFARARVLVLDADALNAVAKDTQLQTLLRHRQAKQWITVITPHPLEAARLLQISTTGVMADRLAAARALTEKFGVICVLKGSGTIIQAPGEPPLINASGNGALATAGTGDVLAGMIGASLATSSKEISPGMRTAQAVFEHGRLADNWVANTRAKSLCADQLTSHSMQR